MPGGLAAALAAEARICPPSAYQQEAMRWCVVLRHQARILADKGYISQKQLERWQKLTTSMYWRLRAWAKADAKR